MPQPSRAKSSEVDPPDENGSDDGSQNPPKQPEAPRMAFKLTDLLERATAFFPDISQAQASLAGATHGMDSDVELTLVQARDLINDWRGA